MAWTLPSARELSWVATGLTQDSTQWKWSKRGTRGVRGHNVTSLAGFGSALDLVGPVLRKSGYRLIHGLATRMRALQREVPGSTAHRPRGTCYYLVPQGPAWALIRVYDHCSSGQCGEMPLEFGSTGSRRITYGNLATLINCLLLSSAGGILCKLWS